MNAHASDKTRILALAAVATLGFGLLQGARLLDLNTGPYSPTPYALVGLAADGLTFLVVAVLSYLGRIDRAKPLFVTAVVVSSIYAVLVASGNTNDIALIAMQVTAGMGWSLSILCWMEVFTSYRPRLSLPLIAAAYLIDTLLPPLTSSLFPGGRSIMLLASFVLSTVALLWCLHNNAFVAQQMKESVAPATSMAEALSRTKRAVAGTFAFSLICGFVIELDILRYASKRDAVGDASAPEEAAAVPLAHLSAGDALVQMKGTYELTNREFEVIEEFAAGRSARAIAERFTLSEHTVKTHLRHAYAKMDVHSRQELLDLIEETSAAKKS